MSVAYIDPLTGDFPIGSIPIVSGKDAICQRIKTCLCLIKGESCFYPDAGIDLTNAALRRQSNRELITATYREQILAIQGISDISSFEISFNGTEATYTVSVECEDGENFTTGGLIDGF